MSAKKLLEVNELTIAFGDQTVVDHISFSIDKGETVSLVGESGSGKSMSSFALMGLLPQHAKIKKGTAKLIRENKSIDLLNLSESEMQAQRGKHIAMIFQEPMTSLNPSITCGDQVMEAIQLHQNISKSEARKLTLEWFERVKLPRAHTLIDAYPHQLSGGQKQRVMIAMAMSSKPDILIADEPTTALDVTVQKAILELIKELQKEFNMGVLFITHDLGVVHEVSDKVIVMYKGKVVEYGGTAQIMSAPQHSYTQGLIACRPPMDRKLKKLPVITDFIEQTNVSAVELLKKRTIDPATLEAKQQKIYNAPPILEVENLETKFVTKKNFFGKPVAHYEAVRKVNFKLFAGETLGLVGESGCGKTTLGRTLVQLIKSSGGTVKFKGRKVLNLKGKELKEFRKKLQIIFQDPYSSLNPRMTIGQSIMEPMKVHGLFKTSKERKKEAIDLLEKVGLDISSFSRYPHEFSGGQRQRIGIARALALQAEIIVCDESVSALDMSVQAQVLNLLNELKEEFQLTFLFISHDLSVVKYMSDRIIVMKEGKIEEAGNAEDIYHRPKSDYTKTLIEAIPKQI